MANEVKRVIHDYQIRAILSGYVWECDCGEMHQTERDAIFCRKCRVYLTPADFDNRKVANLEDALWDNSGV